MAKSDYVLGRSKSAAAFKQGQPFCVSAYWCRSTKRMRYTDPLLICTSPNRVRWGKLSSVRYIVHVKPKVVT